MNSSSSPKPLRVLVADDDEEMRAFVSAALRADGCSTVEARDGRELLDMVRNGVDGEDLHPDVVVADVKMPGLSGLGVLAALQRTEWDLPVVLITAFTDESIHMVARRLGAVSILHKPFDPEDLVTAVRNATAIWEVATGPHRAIA
jgi:CheY-like chemotaxis protein